MGPWTNSASAHVLLVYLNTPPQITFTSNLMPAQQIRPPTNPNPFQATGLPNSSISDGLSSMPLSLVRRIPGHQGALRPTNLRAFEISLRNSRLTRSFPNLSINSSASTSHMCSRRNLYSWMVSVPQVTLSANLFL